MKDTTAIIYNSHLFLLHEVTLSGLVVWWLLGLGGVSVVDSLENASKVSGKLGGVAGVFAGVHIGLNRPFWWWYDEHDEVARQVSLKYTLNAFWKCQLFNWSNCLAWSWLQPATSTNWLIITWSRSDSIFSFYGQNYQVDIIVAHLNIHQPP